MSLRNNINASLQMYEQMGYDPGQLAQLDMGLWSGLDVQVYADKRYSAPQMRWIRKGLKEGLDTSYYMDFNIPAKDMKAMYKVLQRRYKKKSTIESKIAMIKLSSN